MTWQAEVDGCFNFDRSIHNIDDRPVVDPDNDISTARPNPTVQLDEVGEEVRGVMFAALLRDDVLFVGGGGASGRPIGRRRRPTVTGRVVEDLELQSKRRALAIGQRGNRRRNTVQINIRQ